MNRFAARAIEDRAAAFSEVAARRNITPLIVEKDFWACFALRILFEDPQLGHHLVFKGGTSLSKVFGIIDRFSEDLDLSIAPDWLVGESGNPETARSRSERLRRHESLQGACDSAVRHAIAPLAEARIVSILGRPAHSAKYISAGGESGVLHFAYPTREALGAGYIEPRIKLEFGSLTGQRPTGKHAVTPWVAEEFPHLFTAASAEVTALEAERTFWEKATILHAEHHRPPEKPMRVRHSRDCYDLCAIWEHPSGRRAVSDQLLREEVVAFKEQFFRAGWTRFDLARPGTFRIVPAAHRVAELRRDYHEMRPMFLSEPRPFDELLNNLGRIEEAINGSATA